MSSLNFIERGSGQPVLLIHGFPLHQEVWNDFADQLSRSFRIFTIDLPGFGKSSLLKSPFSIDDVASSILLWISERKLQRITIVGHSLGGYVALSMIEQNPKLFKGLCLFHSTALADNQEKKESRNKVLEFVEKNGAHAFTSNFIPPLFANQQHPAIDKVRKIAMQASEEAVKGYTKAMRDRPDRTRLLKDFPGKILIISGEKDGAIPADSIRKQVSHLSQIEVHILPGVGHMGMLEKPNKIIEIIHNFITKSNQP